jgi:hypothetical protein
MSGRGPSRGSSESLRWITYEQAYDKWTPAERMVLGQHTTDSPALAYATTNVLFCAYRAATGGQVDCATYVSEWERPSTIGTATGSPALAAYRERMYCVRPEGSALLASASDDGMRWNAGTDLGVRVGTHWEGPALTAHGDHLYCAYAPGAAAGPPRWWWTRYDGIDWLGPQDSGLTCAARPALSSYQGYLVCVYADLEGGHPLMFSMFDEDRLTWEEPSQVPGTDGMGLPALAVHDDELHCVSATYGDQGAFRWQIFADLRWLPAARVITLPEDAPWARPPALAVYGDRLRCAYATDRL